MAKTLSIIVPVYNAEKTLDRCVQSVVSQSCLAAASQSPCEWELILVDDGSTDGSAAICDAWSKKESRISVIHTDRKGPSAARNAGLDAASGRLIAFVDADDYLEQGMYDDVMRKMQDDVDMLEYGWIRKGVNHVLPEKTYPSAKEYWESCRVWTHGYVWNKVFRRELIGDTRFGATNIAEDLIFMVDILQKHPCVATTSFVGYTYVVNENGLSFDTSVKGISRLLKAQLYAVRKMRTLPLSKDGLNLYYCICCRLYDIVRFSLFRGMERTAKH